MFPAMGENGTLKTPGWYTCRAASVQHHGRLNQFMINLVSFHWIEDREYSEIRSAINRIWRDGP